MLVDVTFRPDPLELGILSIIAGSRGLAVPKRIGQGMYLCGHWNAGDMTPTRSRWRETPATYLDFEEYGVCDTPEQCVEKLKLRDRPDSFFVSFVHLRKADEPSSGGWRWHKWGDYIGKQDPQCEYLHDEPVIEEVYTFHVYEPVGSVE